MSLDDLEGMMADVAALNGLTLEQYILGVDGEPGVAQRVSVRPDLLVLSPTTAYRITEDPDFAALKAFAAKYHLALKLNTRCPHGMIYLTEQAWNEPDQE